MLNTSISLINISIEENNEVILSMNAPYPLLGSIMEAFTKPGRKIKYNIDGNIIVEPGHDNRKDVDVWDQYHILTSDPKHRSKRVYGMVQEAKNLYNQYLQDVASMKLQQDQIDEASMVRQEAELHQRMIDMEKEYSEMVLFQKNLTEEQKQRNLAEQFRQDENRIALVRAITLDTTASLDALQSEFGQSVDIRSAVANAMSLDPEVCRAVARLDSKYWLGSYEIMAVLSEQCENDHVLASIIASSLPDDSVLKNLLINMGWAT
jgi:hypothetical protein